MTTEKKTTRNSEFSVGHAINKGYPFNGILSKVTYQQESRPDIRYNEETKKLGGNIPIPKDSTGPETKEDEHDLLLEHLYTALRALSDAEGQISDLMEESPFIPEDFGFEVVHEHKDTTEPPVRIYISRFNTGVAIFRKPGEPNDANWNPEIWTIQRNIDGVMKTDDVWLPCHRIAYAVFLGLMIKIEETIK
jgi:hypothetical protein